MKIIEYEQKYESEVKDLLIELQEYLASLDKRGVIVLKENYCDGYFAFVAEECAKHEGNIFIAIANGHAIGMIVCKIFQGGGEDEFATLCSKIGFISDLVVTEDKRGHGIGKQLVKRAEKYFYENGCEYTQLEVFAPNKKAFELYKKLDFGMNCYYLSKNVLYANGHTKSKLELKQSNQCKSKSRDSLRNLGFI